MSTLTTTSRALIAALSLTSFLFAMVQNATGQAGVNGRNVTVVDIGQSGRKLGEYRQIAPRQWVETNVAGAVTFRYEETQRDDWSVYLVDRSRGVNLQLDLHTRKVMYSDAGSPRRALYDVLAASAQPVSPTTAAPALPRPPTAAPAPSAPPGLGANGRNGTVVEIGQSGRKLGEYRQIAPREWVEINAAGAVTFRYEETQRDDWSIYLVDRSRGVNLQLDLHTRKVMYSDAGSPRRALYDVLAASSPPVPQAPATPPVPSAAGASAPLPALPARGGFYVIAHMVNTPASVDWAIGQGANAAEIDLNFEASGKPVRFHHGGICDCTCFAGGVCSALNNSCEASTPAGVLLNHVARKPSIALTIIDSKVGDLDRNGLVAGGSQAIALLDVALFGSGYNGVVLVGVPSIAHLDYLRAAVTAANESPNRSRYWFSIDQESDNVAGVLGALATLPTQNRVFGTGISACAPGNYESAITLAAANERAGVSALSYAWTIDKESSMEAYIQAGARGIITNHPARLVSVARRKGVQLASAGGGLASARSAAVQASLGSCDCNYHSGGCTISRAAPANLACKCSYKGAWTCGGEVTSCSNQSSPTCVRPDNSKVACALGGGDCGGY